MTRMCDEDLTADPLRTIMPNMAIWLTGDTHFGHKNIIEYCKRPFRTIDGQLDVIAMDKALITRWNEVVQPKDLVYHLGDFALGSKRYIPNYRRCLNGRIVLLRGNHDPDAQRLLQAGFDEVHERLTLCLEGYDVVLRHKPFQRGEPFPDCDFAIVGHVHDKWKISTSLRQVNVGCDAWGLAPVSPAAVVAAWEAAGEEK